MSKYQFPKDRQTNFGFKRWNREDIDYGRISRRDGPLVRISKEDDGFLDIGSISKKDDGFLDIGRISKKDEGFLDLGRISKKDDGFLDLGRISKKDDGFLDLGRISKKDYGPLDLGRIAKKDDGFLDIGRISKKNYGLLELGRISKKDDGFLDIGRISKRDIDSEYHLSPWISALEFTDSIKYNPYHQKYLLHMIQKFSDSTHQDYPVFTFTRSGRSNLIGANTAALPEFELCTRLKEYQSYKFKFMSHILWRLCHQMRNNYYP